MRLRHRVRRAFGHSWPRRRSSLVIIAALLLAGCANSDQTVTGSIPPAGMKTIAFESVDGPPKPVFDRLVAALSAEAERRELPVVTHNGPATYRVRAYLATLVEKKKKQARLSWVWEVFDASQNRAFRLSGEEALGIPRNDVWAQCDDALLLRVAAKGFDELVARLGPLPSAPAPSVEPQPAGPAVAFADPQL
ncbi:MAG: hypothetical protein WD207_10765 [Xanthobacteraceae bacterium]